MKKRPQPTGEKKRPRRITRQWKPPKLKGVPISVSRQLPVVWLQANYDFEEDGVTRVSGQTPEGRVGKDRFQHDGLLYARALGQALALYGGFTVQRVTRNRGRQQTAGSVMASFYRPEHPYWLSVYIESDPSKTAIPRPDGVIILACRHSYQKGSERERIHCLNPAMSSLQFALVLLLLVGLKKAGDLEEQHRLAQRADLRPQSLFGDEPAERMSPSQPGARPQLVVRVWLLGAYRQCLLLKPGKTSVEIVCIDDHPLLALSYWGKQSTQPIARVHPEDQPLCAEPPDARTPDQAHQVPSNRVEG